MALTETELRTLIAAFRVELSDMVQAEVLVMLGINYGEIAINQGTTTIEFTHHVYDTADEWDFIKCVALATTDGAEIGCDVSVKTKDGFEITVEEACTFKWRTSYKGINSSISD